MDELEWWRRGVIYNAYPRSWRDSNGDGIGDLRGIIERLDYLQWLGVTGLWLNPIMPSPNWDWGYDVSDYYAIHPDFGDLADFDALVSEAGRRGIQLVLDLVPSHTSHEHPWFENARRGPGTPFRDYYVWRRARSDGGPPTNWLSYLGRPAWTLDEASGEYYMHNFSPHQPQLNWWNPAVASEFDRIVRFWFDRGVGGLRLDALQALLYDREFRDNPAPGGDDSEKERRIGQRFAFNCNRPETHPIVRRWHSIARSYPVPRLLFGETWVAAVERLAAYYGSGDDELDMAWNLPFLSAPFDARALFEVVDRTLRLLPEGAVPTWAISTHDDDGRAASRWCGGGAGAIRCALTILLALWGTPVLYYGDEIGMLDLPRNLLAAARRERPDSRDRARGPMQWDASPGVGFTSAVPWLPAGDASQANVADQRGDPRSVLRFCRDLIRLRGHLFINSVKLLPAPAGVLAWLRGKALIAVNLSDQQREITATGTIALCTDRARDGDVLNDTLILAPWQAAIVVPCPTGDPAS